MTDLSSLTVPELVEKVRSYWAPNQAPQVVMVDVAELARRAEEAEALRLACANELHERNEDLREWRPKMEALAEALEGLLAFYEAEEGDRPWFAQPRAVLARYRGEK